MVQSFICNMRRVKDMNRVSRRCWIHDACGSDLVWTWSSLFTCFPTLLSTAVNHFANQSDRDGELKSVYLPHASDSSGLFTPNPKTASNQRKFQTYGDILKLILHVTQIKTKSCPAKQATRRGNISASSILVWGTANSWLKPKRFIHSLLFERQEAKKRRRIWDDAEE